MSEPNAPVLDYAPPREKSHVWKVLLQVAAYLTFAGSFAIAAHYLQPPKFLGRGLLRITWGPDSSPQHWEKHVNAYIQELQSQASLQSALAGAPSSVNQWSPQQAAAKLSIDRIPNSRLIFVGCRDRDPGAAVAAVTAVMEQAASGPSAGASIVQPAVATALRPSPVYPLLGCLVGVAIVAGWNWVRRRGRITSASTP